MNNCINIKSVEFQTRLKQSGLSEFDYAVQVQKYFNQQRKMGVPEDQLKYPELDMVNGANSSEYLSENIKLKNDEASIQNILNYTKSDNIEDATIQINNKHRDLEVNILPLNESALVQIEQRPTNLSSKNNPKVTITKEKQALVTIFDKLRKLYGINIHNVTIADLVNDPKFKDVTDAKHTNAFILNGDIYINMDVADIDAPIHEMAHIMLGSIKYQNPQLYNELVSISEQLPFYSESSKNYSGRTRSDINEEIFVTEIAKFLANKSSVIQEIPENIQYEILYNIKRLLDSMLMGDTSVKTISTDRLMQMSICDIAEVVNSQSFSNISKSIMNDAHLHRILNNRKSDLINSNKLKENCQ